MSQVSQAKKLPRNYQVVYDVVSAQAEGEHAAAGDIYAAAKRLQAGIGYSTVYRALDRLRDLGLVFEVRVPGSSSALYEAARASHAHFRCVACGRIDDIPYELPAGEVRALAERCQVAISDVVLTFNGRCAACRTAAVETC